MDHECPRYEGPVSVILDQDVRVPCNVTCLICHGENVSGPDMFVTHLHVPGLRTGSPIVLQYHTSLHPRGFSRSGQISEPTRSPHYRHLASPGTGYRPKL